VGVNRAKNGISWSCYTSCNAIPASAIEGSASSWGIIVWPTIEGNGNLGNGRASISHAREQDNCNAVRVSQV
jgi:hypothetical protein